MQKEYGYIPDIRDEEKDYVFGSALSPVPKIILQENADWSEFLPENEWQSPNGFESYSCVSHSSCNCIEILIKRLFGTSTNWSDRKVAKDSDTKIGGNSPKKVLTAIRDKGLVSESLWPTAGVMSFTEYYKDIPQNVSDKGLKWLDEYELLYEDIVKISPKSLKDALKMSPLSVSVPAWTKGQNGLYIRPQGQKDNHLTCLIGYKEGEYWLIYDTYPDDGSPLKKVEWNISFELAKRFYIGKKEPVAPKKTGYWAFIRSIFGL